MNSKDKGGLLSSQADLDALLKNKETFLLDVFGSWCQPCKALMPTLDRINKETDYTVYLIDVDNPEFSNFLDQAGVRSVPTVFTVINGEITHTSVGVSTKDELLKTFS